MGGRGSYKADSRVDEFCNYVGPDLESEDDSDSEEEQQREEGDGVDQEEIQHDEEEGGQSMVAFVLHKDNKYYPTAWWWGSLVQWEVCHFGGGWVWLGTPSHPSTPGRGRDSKWGEEEVTRLIVELTW